jgi:Bcr/CflA subfamily drug resistance transporter
VQNRFVAILILFLMTLAQIGTDVYLPSFPEIKSQLATTSTLVQLTFSFFLGGFALSQLVYGPLSDRYGRKSFLLVGVGIYFTMSLVAAATHSISVLLIARALQGIGAGACSVIPRAIMSDTFSGKTLEKMTIYQSMVWSVIPISAPLLGSYIQHYLNWRFNFLLLAAISLTAFIMCLIFKETNQQQETHLQIKQILKNYWQIFGNKYFLSYISAALGVIAVLMAFNVSAPLLLRETLHLSALQYGWSIFSVAISFILGAMINRYLLGIKSSLVIVKYGVILVWLAGLTLMLFALFSKIHLLEILLPIFILQIGCALIFPTCASKIMTLFANMAGKTAAIFGASIFSGGALASVVMSFLSVHSLLPLAIFIIFMNGLILISYRIMTYYSH